MHEPPFKQQHFLVSQLYPLQSWSGLKGATFLLYEEGLRSLGAQLAERLPCVVLSWGGWKGGFHCGCWWDRVHVALPEWAAQRSGLPEKSLAGDRKWKLPPSGMGPETSRASLFPTEQSSIRVSPDSSNGGRDATCNGGGRGDVKEFRTTFNSSKGLSFLNVNLMSRKYK